MCSESQSYARALDRVEQAPEDVALLREGGQAALLVLCAACVLEHEGEALAGVARRLAGARSEVAQAIAVDPGVVLLERLDPQLHQVAGEELGQ